MKSGHRLLCALLARWLAACGAIAYRLGWRAAARRRFERVLQLRGGDFAAHVQLGRIAFDLGDYAAWRREFEQARRIDPRRFARLRHPLELFEPRLAGTAFDPGTADDDFDGTGARATWRALRPLGGGPLGKHPEPFGSSLDALLPGCDARAESSPPRSLGRLPADGAGTPDASVSHDDCSTAEERRRFVERGPIVAQELARCDLDELLRRLSG